VYLLLLFTSVNEISETIRNIYATAVGMNNLKIHFKTEKGKLEQNAVMNKFRVNMT